MRSINKMSGDSVNSSAFELFQNIIMKIFKKGVDKRRR